MKRINELLKQLTKREGSALHVVADTQPRVRVKGRLVRLDAKPMSDADIDKEVLALVDESIGAKIKGGQPTDFPCEVDGTRYRARYGRTAAGPSLVLRTTALEADIGDLGLPASVTRLAHLRRGLVLIAGASGSGKSTAVAAMLQEVDGGRPKHIATIESPIELIYRHRRCTVSQREVGTHTNSFASGIEAAMRQGAEVIFTSELPDAETLQLALAAVDAGALVIATMSAGSVIRAIERLIELAPQRVEATRHSLIENLNAVVVLLRLPQADSLGHCIAAEVLLRGRGLVTALRDNDLQALNEIMQQGQGMQTMDDALDDLLDHRRIALEDAYDHARDKQRFRRQRKGARRAIRRTRMGDDEPGT